MGVLLVAKNRRAFFDYEISDRYEAGLVLKGSEVKSLRLGHASITEAFVGVMQSELYIFNAQIQVYEGANQFNHEPKRPRKLLLHAKEISKLIGQLQQAGYSLVPIELYFKNGRAKLAFGLGRGKKNIDKRETIKRREWERSKAKILRNHG